MQTSGMGWFVCSLGKHMLLTTISKITLTLSLVVCMCEAAQIRMLPELHRADFAQCQEG